MLEKHTSIAPPHPGEIPQEDILPALPHSKTAVAKALGISRQTLYDIINERQPITAEMAVPFGNGARLWLILQRNYDLEMAEQSTSVREVRALASTSGS